MRRRCDRSKSLSTFNKQVVGESPPIGVSGRKHQVGINNATGSQIFKHDIKKKQVTVCLGVSIRLPARTESFGVDQFYWGWKTLRVDHNRRWPVFMDTKLSGCTLGSSTMAVPDKNKRCLQALVQHREMNQPGALLRINVPFHLSKRRRRLSMQGGCQSEQNKNDAAGQSHIKRE